jgi:hypothetical protein
MTLVTGHCRNWHRRAAATARARASIGPAATIVRMANNPIRLMAILKVEAEVARLSQAPSCFNISPVAASATVSANRHRFPARR